jgi:hypothetical protein
MPAIVLRFSFTRSPPSVLVYSNKALSTGCMCKLCVTVCTQRAPASASAPIQNCHEIARKPTPHFVTPF